MPVVAVTDRLRVEPDHVYVIPPNADMTIGGGVFALTPRAAVDRHTADRPLLPLARAGAGRPRDRRGAVGDRVGRHARPPGDQGGGRHHVRPGREIREAPRHAPERGARSPTSSCRPPAIARELARIGGHPYVNHVVPARRPAPDQPEERGRRQRRPPCPAHRHRRRFRAVQAGQRPAPDRPPHAPAEDRRPRDVCPAPPADARRSAGPARRPPHPGDGVLPGPGRVRGPQAERLPEPREGAGRRRAHPDLGAGLRHGRRGLLARDLPAGVPRGAGQQPADPDVRHRPQRRRGHPGPGRDVPREHRARGLARAAAAVLRQDGRAISDQQGDPGRLRLRAAGPDAGTRRSRSST